MSSFLRRVSGAVVVAVALLAPSALPVASANNTSIIFMDYTSGYFTILPTPHVNAVEEATYLTGPSGGYRFGVDWNQDATDAFTINVPATPYLTITPENDPDFCTPDSTTVPPNQITFQMTGVHQCNYTAHWTGGFSGVLTVTYTSGPSQGTAVSDAISTFFTNPGTVGDPQFVGLRGQSYQVHGIDGAVYNIISEKNTQVNSRFVFLTQGKCPTVAGSPQDNCWSHPGSYLGEMSFQQVVDGKLHQALVQSGPGSKGFSSVEVDGQTMKVGDVVSYGEDFSITFVDAFVVQVAMEHFSFTLSNSDSFINQAVRATVPLTKLKAHGLLGQTASAQLYPSALKYIAGQVDDYAIQNYDIYGNDFVYNLFKA